MRKIIIYIALIATLILTSGCISDSKEQTESGIDFANENQINEYVTEITDLNQIDDALLNGPVLLKIGSNSCASCKTQNAILEGLAPEYISKAEIMTIDLDKNPQFGKMFNVYSIPDSCVIVEIKNENYVYVLQDGTTTTERARARYLGVADKTTLAKTLDLAIKLRTSV